MTIAELHGKLSPDRPDRCNDRMEDLLLSDVFGTMKYAGWENGFLDWLRSSIDPANNDLFAASHIAEDYQIKKINFYQKKGRRNTFIELKFTSIWLT